MALDITNFRSNFDGGARPNLFEVTITDFGVAGGQNFLVKGASLPASTVASIDVPFRGRIIKVAGDRTFEDWTVTFYNNNDFLIRGAFEDWMQQYLNTHVTNIGEPDQKDYYKNMSVKQLNKADEVVAEYTIYDAFPTNVSAIDLNYDTGDTVEEFEVTFAYNYWKRDADVAGS
jgi:hypothetical protein